MAKVARSADIPGIRNNEAAAFVQLSKSRALNAEIGVRHRGSSLAQICCVAVLLRSRTEPDVFAALANPELTAAQDLKELAFLHVAD